MSFLDNGSRVSGLWGFSWLGRDPKKHLPTAFLCISAVFLDEIAWSLDVLVIYPKYIHCMSKNLPWLQRPTRFANIQNYETQPSSAILCATQPLQSLPTKTPIPYAQLIYHLPHNAAASAWKHTTSSHLPIMEPRPPGNLKFLQNWVGGTLKHLLEPEKAAIFPGRAHKQDLMRRYKCGSTRILHFQSSTWFPCLARDRPDPESWRFHFNIGANVNKYR